jgi:hypothetical protein
VVGGESGEEGEDDQQSDHDELLSEGASGGEVVGGEGGQEGENDEQSDHFRGSFHSICLFCSATLLPCGASR